MSSLSSSNTAHEPVAVLAKQPSTAPVVVAQPTSTPPATTLVDPDSESDDATYEDTVDVRLGWVCTTLVATAWTPSQVLLHPDAHEEGGMGCANKATFESQRGYAQAC